MCVRFSIDVSTIITYTRRVACHGRSITTSGQLTLKNRPGSRIGSITREEIFVASIGSRTAPDIEVSVPRFSEGRLNNLKRNDRINLFDWKSAVEVVRYCAAINPASREEAISRGSEICGRNQKRYFSAHASVYQVYIARE